MGSFLSMMNGGTLRFVPFTIFKIFAKRCFACYKFNVCCCAVSLYSDDTRAAGICQDFLCFFKRNIQVCSADRDQRRLCFLHNHHIGEYRNSAYHIVGGLNVKNILLFLPFELPH